MRKLNKKKQKIINPNKFRILSALAKYRNMTHAGAELHLTQPAISHAVSQLESELGISLLQKTGKKAELTEAGQRIQSFWKEFENLYVEINQVANSFKDEDIESIRIALVNPAKYFLPRLLDQFSDAHPNIHFTYHILSWEDVVSGCQSGNYDFGIITNPPQYHDLDNNLLTKNSLHFVCNKNHPLAKQEKINFKDLEKQSYIIHKENTPLSSYLYNYFEYFNATPNISYDINDAEIIKQRILQSDSLSIMAYATIQENLKLPENQLKVLDVPYVEGLDMYYWYLIQPKQHRKSAVKTQFFNFISEEIEKLKLSK